jgi:signal transduction histidine kinase
MRSIRASIAAGTAAVIVLVLAAAGTWVYYGVHAALVQEIDATLRRDVAVLASMTDVYPSRFKIDLEPFRVADFAAGSGDTYFQFWLGDVPVYRSSSLQGHDLAPLAGSMESPRFHWLDLDGRVRAVGVQFVPRVEDTEEDEFRDATDPVKPSVRLEVDARGRQATLVLARRTHATDTFLARLRLLLLGMGLVAAAVAVATLWAVIIRSLNPLEVLAQRIAALRADDTGARIFLPGAPAEVRPVVQRLNEWLERIDSAMQRERSFSAHVAHELRTPVAALRSTLEVVRSRRRESHEFEAATAQCLLVVRQMQEMVEALLHLFRLEAGREALQPESFDLSECVRTAWDRLVPLARARDLKTELVLAGAAGVTTDRGLLRVAIGNLLENAAQHANAGGFVRIEVTADAGGAALRVRNSGSRLEPSDMVHVFDRFWRGDAARASSGEHIGLGLALVKKIAAVLGATVEATSTGGIFEIQWRMPRVPPRLC